MLIGTTLGRFGLRLVLWSCGYVFCCGPGFCAGGKPGQPAGPARPEGSAEAVVTISVYSEANVAAGDLAHAEAIATRIFRHAGLEMEWLDCGSAPQEPEDLPARESGVSPEQALEVAVPQQAEGRVQGVGSCSEAVYPAHLRLRILPRVTGATTAIFGLSYYSPDKIGCYSEVFFSRILQLHEVYHQSIAVILGHVMAHEIGHLLLGVNSHSATGIMRAHWEPEDLVNASQGRLLFTPEQGEAMRRNALGSRQEQLLANRAGETARSAH